MGFKLTPIRDPGNYSAYNTIQEPWLYREDACGRIPADYNRTIVCRPYGVFSPSANISLYPGVYSSRGWEFETFQKCCPLPKTGKGIPYQPRNVYIADWQCQTQYCYTSNQTLAEEFPDCVRQAGNEGVAKLRAQNVTIPSRDREASGLCEWVKYDVLRNGVQSGASISSRDLGKLAALMGSLAIIVVIHGIL